ncbi:antibiotic biosynthesis monooxygenase [Arenibacter sp. F20364]|uniref:antibiotic biosynthesis monooxygenase family protein n=1 Tax=Arenibacter sp. F20364 TaxID=2926415 RepID=UPI001FF68506|nr:antibiotic biosynthesis monooxygenase [Arenibacter sp. F20364]MCK0192726.1 antibiotic biosynthesis monooxygenase [Arenibacter sp. F20364]
MVAVIFEVHIKKEKKNEYLDIASELKLELTKIEGFISIERFQSISEPNKLLSLSFWQNEDAIKKWRNLEIHRQAQSKGIKSIFKDYRIRIGYIVRDYGMFDRKKSPNDSKMSLGA